MGKKDKAAAIRRNDEVALEIIEEGDTLLMPSPRDSVAPAQDVVPVEPRPIPAEAFVLIEAARAEMERVMREDFKRAERTLALHYEEMQGRLTSARDEIQRLSAQTAAMRKDPVHEVVRDAQQRLFGL